MQVQLEDKRCQSPPATAAALRRFQTSSNLTLPSLLREFLLNHDGGLLLGGEVHISPLSAIRVIESHEIKVLGFRRTARLQGKLVQFAIREGGHCEYLLNFADLNQDGQPTVYAADPECGAPVRLFDGFESFMRHVMAADDQPAVTLENAKRCGTIIHDHTLKLRSGWITRQVVCVVKVRSKEFKKGIYIFEHDQQGKSECVSRHFLATPLAADEASITTDETSSHLNIGSRNPRGNERISSTRRSDGKWKTERDTGMDSVSCSSVNPAILCSLRTALFGERVNSAHQKIERLEAEHEKYLDQMSKVQSDAVRMALVGEEFSTLLKDFENQLKLLGLPSVSDEKDISVGDGLKPDRKSNSRPKSKSKSSKFDPARDPMVKEAVRRAKEIERLRKSMRKLCREST